jgi:hypothetical protein
MTVPSIGALTVISGLISRWSGVQISHLHQSNQTLAQKARAFHVAMLQNVPTVFQWVTIIVGDSPRHERDILRAIRSVLSPPYSYRHRQ